MAKLIDRIRLKTDDPMRRLTTDIVEISGVRTRVHRLVPEQLDKQQGEATGPKENADAERIEQEVGKELDTAADELSETEAAESEAGTELIDPDNPPTFILVHGIGVSSRYFVPLAEELVKYGQVLLIDLPGFSGLPAPRKRLTIKEFAKVVAEVVELEEIKNPIFVGHSMGAQVVTETVVTMKSDAPVVLVGPPINVKERNIPMSVLRFLQASVHEGPTVSFLALWAYLRCGFAWFFAIVPTMMAYPIETRITKFSGPLALVRGEYDHIAPVGWLETIAAAAKSPKPVEIVEVKNAAHSVIYKHADEIAEVVVKLAKAQAGESK